MYIEDYGFNIRAYKYGAERPQSRKPILFESNKLSDFKSFLATFKEKGSVGYLSQTVADNISNCEFEILVNNEVLLNGRICFESTIWARSSSFDVGVVIRNDFAKSLMPKDNYHLGNANGYQVVFFLEHLSNQAYDILKEFNSLKD